MLRQHPPQKTRPLRPYCTPDAPEAEKQGARGLLEQASGEAQALLLNMANICQYQLQDFPKAIDCLQLYLASRDSQDIRARIAELQSRPAPERLTWSGTGRRAKPRPE